MEEGNSSRSSDEDTSVTSVNVVPRHYPLGLVPSSDSDLRAMEVEERARVEEEPVAGTGNRSGGASLVRVPHLPLQQRHSDTRLWAPIRTVIHDHRQLPAAVQELFSALYLDSSISRLGYVMTLANLCMIETGFVPFLDGKEPVLVSADDLMLQSLPVRMNRCIDVLTAIARAKYNLNEVFYRFIRKSERAGEPGHAYYEYGEDLLKFRTWHNSDTFISLEGAGHSVEYKLQILSRYISSITNWQRLTLPNMIMKFDSKKLISDVKVEICYQFIDTLGCVGSDGVGFGMLPNELIEHFAQFLDLKSFVSLLGTCRRTYIILNKDVWWKILCERIPLDFANYGLPVPSRASLRTRIDAPGSTYLEKYKVFFNEALVNYRRAHNRRFQLRNYPIIF